jgi:iron complex outermembrane receptor protein
MGDEESIYGTLYLKWIINSKWVLSINSKAQIDQSVGASAYYQAVENDSIAKIDPYKFAVNDVGTNSRKISNTSISVTSFQDKFTVHSISSFQYILQAYDHIDQDLLPYDYAYGSSYKDNLGEAYPQSVCSEELRFSSPNNSSKFKWTAGAYFFRQESNKKYATVYKDLAYFFGSTPGIEVNQANTLNSGAAIFAQVDYSILPSLIFTTGCRFDLETRKAEVSRYRVDEQNNVLSYSYPVTNKQKQYTALSPKLILKFNFTSSHSIYVSYTRGFRAGGINLFSKKVEYNYFDPEYSDNYEFGHKIQSRNKKVLITSSLFAYYWQQLQLDLQPEPGIWITSNIGNVKSVGAEIECSFSPFMGFLVDAALGVNDAKYMGFDYLGTNIKGNQTIFAPKSTFFIAAQQLFPIGKKTLFSLRGEWRRVGLHYFDLVNEIEQKPYNLFNAKIGAEVKNVVVSFWCYNLLDTQYLTYAMPGYFKYSLLNRPRTYGITLSMKFNK